MTSATTAWSLPLALLSAPPLGERLVARDGPPRGPTSASSLAVSVSWPFPSRLGSRAHTVSLAPGSHAVWLRTCTTVA